ncbi:permease [Verrucomicrobium sp. BvORR106]|uniref:permease n=1 Tax=Verrucomicrobium sp. BvORR106 TaxID=1403819 RepID=UPI00056DFCEA|nr:permease [Verrucomicrobium sp. BvORR106]
MTLPEPSATGDILKAFLSILFEGAPYILVGTLLSGLIDAFLPAKLLERVLPKNRVLSTLAAGFLGLVFPVCECAVVPVVRRLVQKGLPISCGITYLLSAPIINPIVIASTLTAFKEFQMGGVFGIGNATMTLSRITLGYAVAVIVGLVLIRKKPEDVLVDSVVRGIGKGAAAANGAPQSFDAKLTHAMRTAMRDFLDTAMYFTIGVIITAAFNTQVDQSRITAVAGNELFAVPTLMGLAFALALCSTSDAFIAAPMDSFSNAAKLAFLVFGPMLDVKLVFMYSSVFRRKFMVGLCVAIFLLVALLCEPWAKWVGKLSNKPPATAVSSTGPVGPAAATQASPAAPIASPAAVAPVVTPSPSTEAKP